MTITIDDMRDQLLTLDEAGEMLAETEPFVQHTLVVDSKVKFQLAADWHKAGLNEPTSAYLETASGQRFQLTPQAVLEAGAYCGIPRGLQRKQPGWLLKDQLNWWYQGGLGSQEFKVFGRDRDNDDPLAMATCRGTIQPFSNIALLDIVVSGLRKQYGEDAEVLVDYKATNSLERTNMRLIVPSSERAVTGSRVDGDLWCAGMEFANSLIGVSHPGTRLGGYFFRYVCTNGQTDNLASTGKLARRTISDPSEAYEWARKSVDEVLGGLEHAFESIQALTTVRVGGSHGSIGQILTELFARSGVPQREQRRISGALTDLDGEITLYDVAGAITQAANDQAVSPRTVDSLLALGGHIAHANHDRCDNCHQLLPEDFAPAAAAVAQLAGSN
jgi:hypothetical protein